MSIDFCNRTQREHVVSLFGSKRDMDIKPLYTYLCPVIIFVCFFSIIFNAILMSISRQGKFVNKSPILLLSLNLAVTDLIASLLNGLTILFNSYLPEVYDIKMGQCSMLMFEVVRCAALVSSALHLLALAFVHYRGIVNPLHYRSTIFFSQHLSRTINIISLCCWIIPLTIMIAWFSSTPCQGFQSADCDYLFLLGFTYRYMVLSVFSLPLILMSIIYVRVFVIISRHQRGRRLEHKRPTTTATTTAATRAATTALASGRFTAAAAPLSQATPASCAEDTDEREAAGGATAATVEEDEQQEEMGGNNENEHADQDERRAAKWAPNKCSVCLRRSGGAKRTREQRLGQLQASSLLPGRSPSSSADEQREQQDEKQTDDEEEGELGGRRLGNQVDALLCRPSNNIDKRSRGHSNRTTGAAQIGAQLLPNGRQLRDCDTPVRCCDIVEINEAQVGAVKGGCARPLHGCDEIRLVDLSPPAGCANSDQSGGCGNGAYTVAPSLESTDCRASAAVKRATTTGRHEGAKAATAATTLQCLEANLRQVQVAPSGVRRAGSSADCSTSATSSALSSLCAAGDGGGGQHEVGKLTRTTNCGGGDDDDDDDDDDEDDDSWAALCTCDGGALDARLARATTTDCQVDAGGRQPVSRPKANRAALVSLSTGESILHAAAEATTTGRALGSSSVGSSLRMKALRRSPRATTTNANSATGSSLRETLSCAAGAGESSIVAKQAGVKISCALAEEQLSFRSNTTGTLPASLINYPPNQLSSATTQSGHIQNIHHKHNHHHHHHRHYEPQRRHIHAQAVPQTNTKALVTTLLILGTYFISYVPAIIYQVLTCIDYCPYPLYEISFSRRVFFGAMTTLLLIAKSIVDPLIYSYRMNEIQQAINRYMSKRRSKSTNTITQHGASMRTSQRCTATYAQSIVTSNQNQSNERNGKTSNMFY